MRSLVIWYQRVLAVPTAVTTLIQNFVGGQTCVEREDLLDDGGQHRERRHHNLFAIQFIRRL